MTSELKIYGSPARDPKYYKELEQSAAGDKRIRFMGPFEGEKVGWILSEVDVLVVPSAWYENTPLVIYEAFAAKTPVVATDLGGMSEVIEHGKNGLLFPLEDVGGLADRLRRLAEDRALIGRLRDGIGPVRTVKENVDELERLYNTLMERKGTAG